MITNEKTPAENPYAKIVQRIVREEFQAFEGRLLEREDRIAAAVCARIMPLLSEVREARDSDKLRIDDLERRVGHLESVLRRAGADTEPPPPSGMQS